MKNVSEYLQVEVLYGLNSKMYFWFDLLKVYLLGDGARRSVLIYRIGKFFYDAGYCRIANLFFLKLQRVYGIYISPAAKVGIGFRMPHPTGIVIGSGVRLGDNVVLYQQVTLGGARVGDARNNSYPKVGSGTVIFAGAKLIGNITIGNDCVFGANAVVTVDVPRGHLAIGVPARIQRLNKGL